MADRRPAAAGPDPLDVAAAGALAALAPAPAPWLSATDGVLRGLAHQLSNRTGTIRAVAEALLGAEPESRLGAALAAEADQLELLLRLLRLLPRELERGPEPVRPADVVADAVALFGHHSSGRDEPVAMEGLETTAPVRVRVPALTHVVLLLLTEASGPDGMRVTVRGGGDDQQSRLAVSGPGAARPDANAVAAAASAILAADGATVVAQPADADAGPAFIVLLPSLQSSRRGSGGG